jgi:hypothetical protein
LGQLEIDRGCGGFGQKWLSQAARCSEWSGPYGEEFATDKSASANYQAELLTAIVSGTSRRNVLGAIAFCKERLQLPVATTTETNQRIKSSDHTRFTDQDQRQAATRRATPRKNPEEKPLSLDKLFQERSIRLRQAKLGEGG